MFAKNPPALLGDPSERTLDPSERLRTHGERGAVLVEHIFTLLGLLIGLVVFFDLLRVSYTGLAAQYAITRAARWGLVGDTINEKTREESIKDKVEEYSRTFGITINRTKVKICPFSNLACTVESAGGPNEPFYISYAHDTALVSLPWAFTLQFGVFAHNEPYPA